MTPRLEWHHISRVDLDHGRLMNEGGAEDKARRAVLSQQLAADTSDETTQIVDLPLEIRGLLDNLAGKPVKMTIVSGTPQTDVPISDLRRRSVRGGKIVFAWQAASLVLNVVATTVLARLLLPEHYGLIGMVTAVLGFVGIFKD